ncbi:MAG: hypothetical protein AAF666_15145 [Pseudomonadota bacterium]
MSAPKAQNNMLPVFIIGGVAVILALYALLSGPGTTPLPRSATGMAGLTSWLKGKGVNIRTFRGRAPLIIEQTGLRILPLYDTDLRNDKVRPETREEVLNQSTEYDINRWVFREKVKTIPTLVILPKWRHGMRLLGVAHKDLLIETSEMDRLLAQIGLDVPVMKRGAKGFSTGTYGLTGGPDAAFDVTALHLQTFTAQNCAPLVGTDEAIILGRCKASSKRVFHLLSDPDLFANHGLSLADHGELAAAVAGLFDTQKAAVMDTTVLDFAISEAERREQYERKWTDFTRMFEWPFTMIWIAFACVGLLVLWRAITRYGPLARLGGDEPAAAKATSIQAKARLLRLANHDGELLRSHIRSRLADLVAELIGPNRKVGAEPLAVLLPMVSRANPELSKELEEAAASTDQGVDVLRRLDRFEKCYDRVKDEFGRPSTPG